MAAKRNPQTAGLTTTLTSGYRPSRTSMPAWTGFGISGRIFDLSSVDVMALDSSIALGLAMLEAPIQTADGQWDIFADDPKVAKFVDRTLHRFWQTSLPIALQAIRYGYSGSEVLYKYDPYTGLVYFNKLRALHPRDIRVLTQNGEYAGLRVTGNGANSSLQATDAKVILDGPKPGVPAKGAWFYHGTHYNTYYGRSRLLSAWLPWRDKCSQDGALDIVRMWYYRLAFTGPRVRHPERDQRQGDGTMIPARDMARQISEWIKVGAGITLPNTWDVKNNTYAWVIEDPKFNGDASGLLDYVKWLDGQITRGLLIPDNIVTEASEVSSGGMGSKKVSEDAFYVLEERVLHENVTTFDDQCVRPLTHLNFGKGAHYEIKMRPLTPARQQAAAEMAGQQGAILGGDPNKQQSAPQSIQGSSDQADNAELEAARNEGGTSGGRDNNLNRLSLDMVGDDSHLTMLPIASINKNRQSRDSFQYRESPRNSGGFGSCGTCSHYTGMGTCNIHGPSLYISPTDSCRYYLEGDGCPEQAGFEQELVAPQESGLSKQSQVCSHCCFFNDAESRCIMFKEMNERCPSIYDLNEKVSCDGRCNLWKPRDAEDFAHVLSYDYQPNEDVVSKDPHESAKNILRGASKIFREAHDKTLEEHERTTPVQAAELVERHAPHMNEESWKHVRDTLNKNVGKNYAIYQEEKHKQNLAKAKKAGNEKEFLENKRKMIDPPIEPPIDDNDHKQHVIHHIIAGAHNSNALGWARRVKADLPNDVESKERPMLPKDEKVKEGYNAAKHKPKEAGTRFAQAGEGDAKNEFTAQTEREREEVARKAKVAENPEIDQKELNERGDVSEASGIKSPLARDIATLQEPLESEDAVGGESLLSRMHFGKLESILSKHGEKANPEDWEEAARWIAKNTGGKVSSTDPKKYVVDTLRDEAEQNVDKDMLPYLKRTVANEMFEEADEGKFKPENFRELLRGKNFGKSSMERKIGSYGMEKLASALSDKLKTHVPPTYKGMLDALTEWSDASKEDEGDHDEHAFKLSDADSDFLLADSEQDKGAKLYNENLEKAKQIHENVNEPDENKRAKNKAQRTSDILAGRYITHKGALINSNLHLLNLAREHQRTAKDLPKPQMTRGQANDLIGEPVHDKPAQKVGETDTHHIYEHGGKKYQIPKEVHEAVNKLHPGAEPHMAKSGKHLTYVLHGNNEARYTAEPAVEQTKAETPAPQTETKATEKAASTPVQAQTPSKEEAKTPEAKAPEKQSESSEKVTKKRGGPRKKTETAVEKKTESPKEEVAKPPATEEKKTDQVTAAPVKSAAEQASDAMGAKPAPAPKEQDHEDLATKRSAERNEQESDPFTHWPLEEKWQSDEKKAEQKVEVEDEDKKPLHEDIERTAKDFDPDKFQKEADDKLAKAKSVPKATMESVDNAVKGALTKLGSSESMPMIIGLLVGGGFVLHLMKRRPLVGLAVGGSLAALLYKHAKGKHALSKMTSEQAQASTEQAKAAAEAIETEVMVGNHGERNTPEDDVKSGNPHPLSGSRLKPEQHQEMSQRYHEMIEGEKGRQKSILSKEGHGPYPDIDNFDYATINDPKRRKAALDAMKASKDLAAKWKKHADWHAEAATKGNLKLNDKEAAYLSKLMEDSKNHSTNRNLHSSKKDISNYYDAASVLHGNSPVALISQSPDSPEAQAIYKEAMNRGYAVVKHKKVNKATGMTGRNVVVIGKPDNVSEVMNLLSKQHLEEVHGKTTFSANFRHKLTDAMLRSGNLATQNKEMIPAVIPIDKPQKEVKVPSETETTKHVNMLHKEMQASMKKHGLDNKQQKDHLDASYEAHQTMGDVMSRKAWLNIEGYHYAPDSTALFNQCVQDGYDLSAVKSGKINGGYSDKDGKICFAANMNRVLKEVYVHEYMHAVDRDDHFSSQPEWQQAWKKEIVDNPKWAWNNSRKNASEGFADFGRLMLYNDWDTIKSKYPMCSSFIGYVKGELPANSYKIPQQVPPVKTKPIGRKMKES